MEELAFSIEYLFVFKIDSRINYDIGSVLHNLKQNKNLDFKSDSEISFNQINVSLCINGVRSEDKVAHKACLLRFTAESIAQDVNSATGLLAFESEITNTLLEMPHESVEILTNTAAAFLARESYTFINDIENKMRKLITIFMTSNVGTGWKKNNIPDNMDDEIKNKEQFKEDVTSNILFYVDFRQLSIFLFKGYSTITSEELNRRLLSGSISLEEIKERVVPKSNWSRYFNGKVSIKDEAINTKWEKLFHLRNKIAHNRSVSEQDYRLIKGVTKELDSIINDAIEKVNEITLTETQKEEIANITTEEVSKLTIANLSSELVNESFKLERNENGKLLIKIPKNNLMGFLGNNGELKVDYAKIFLDSFLNSCAGTDPGVLKLSPENKKDKDADTDTDTDNE